MDSDDASLSGWREDTAAYTDYVVAWQEAHPANSSASNQSQSNSKDATAQQESNTAGSANSAGSKNGSDINPDSNGDVGTYLVRKDPDSGKWVVVGKTDGVTTANAFVNGILGNLGRHAQLGGEQMPSDVTEFTLFNNPSHGFFADVFETAMDKLGFTSTPAQALAGVLQGVQSSGNDVNWVAHSQGGAIFAEAMSYAGGSLSHNSVTFDAGANNHLVTNSIAANVGVQVKGYYFNSFDLVPNVVGANGNPLTMVGSLLAAPLLATKVSPHSNPSTWVKKF